MRDLEEGWRDLTPREQAVVVRLVEELFGGNEELREQLAGVQAMTIDEEGSLALRVQPGAPAAPDQLGRLPLDAYYKDVDGVLVDVLLHVLDGRLNELELVKHDDSRVVTLPEEADIVVY